MGLAAGLGIAALASYLGFGEALTMFLTVLLIGMALLLIAGFVMRRMRGGTPQPAYGTAQVARLRSSTEVRRALTSMSAMRVLRCLRTQFRVRSRIGCTSRFGDGSICAW